MSTTYYFRLLDLQLFVPLDMPTLTLLTLLTDHTTWCTLTDWQSKLK